ncbi:MAG: hypothetical protein QG580_346 [Patescibacteria group bacterium]|jgi:murein DD-endopeptidase MepM/ murein hydrolase activator NlpD|nr:hypothetical protein [Patescibacteria group bacterium]
MADETETGGGTQVSTSVYIKDGKLVKETIRVSGPAPESEELKKLHLEQEAKEREEKRKVKQDREEREAKEREALRKREDDERAANRAHIEKMVTKTESRWWRYLFAVILGAIIVWISWSLFVCSDCMQGRVGDPYQNDEGFQLPDAPEPEEVDETAQAEESSSEEGGEEEVAEVDQSYGIYTPGDPNLMLRLVAHFSGPERHNFRKFDHFGRRDSLDGENKYVLLAAQLATLISSNRKVVKMGENWKVVEATYNESSILEDAGRQAWDIGQRALHETPYQNVESFEYWVNAAVEDVPSSSSTDFSEAVRACIENFHETLKERNVPEINDIKFKFAGLKTSKPKTKKKTSETKARPMLTSAIPKGFYQNPVPGSKWKERHWDGKKYARDMMADTGTPVYASASGRVIRAGYGGVRSGIRVTISDKYAKTFYGHLSKMYVKKGQHVKKGQLIGRVGHTGSAEADSPHLHLEFFPKVRNFRMPTHDWH